MRGDCKTCFAARAKTWYAKNREHVIGRVKAWQGANPERVNAVQRAARAARPEHFREGHLRRTFAITVAQYEAMLANQGGGCAICGRRPREDRSLHVDHDHDTGVVRGLLCFSCNAGLGQFREEPDRLVDALMYLEGSAAATDPNRAERALLVGLIAELVVGGAAMAPLVDGARQLAVTNAQAGPEEGSE